MRTQVFLSYGFTHRLAVSFPPSKSTEFHANFISARLKRGKESVEYCHLAWDGSREITHLNLSERKGMSFSTVFLLASRRQFFHFSCSIFLF